MSFLADRLSKLEQSTATLSRLRGSADPSTRGTIRRDELDTTSPEKEMNTDTNDTAPDNWLNNSQRTETQNLDPVTTTPRDCSTHQTSEAMHFLHRELESSVTLEEERYAVLNRAVKFVDRISNAENLSYTSNCLKIAEVDSSFKPERFSSELLYMLTSGK